MALGFFVQLGQQNTVVKTSVFEMVHNNQNMDKIDRNANALVKLKVLCCQKASLFILLFCHNLKLPMVKRKQQVDFQYRSWHLSQNFDHFTISNSGS